MADDIDIEEHDILDNPRIQDILHIKEEPIYLDSDVFEAPEPSYGEYNQYEYYTEDNYDQSTDDQIQSYDQEPTDDQVPSYDQEPADDEEPVDDQELADDRETADSQETADDQEPAEQDYDQMEYNPDTEFDESVLESETEYNLESNDIYPHKNKIILGSKPCKRPTRDVSAAYVSLEDWGVRLDNSNVYCKECQTLFATRNALDAHNMIAHSLLVALDTPEEDVSEPEPENVEKTETAKYCDHCKMHFPSDHALIQHLYDLITANKTPATVKETPLTVTPEKATVDQNRPNNTDKMMVYSCRICNSAYSHTKWTKIHLRVVHKLTGMNHVVRIPFTGVCRICNNKYANLKSFNAHVKTVHIDAENLGKCTVVDESQQDNVAEDISEHEFQPENDDSPSDSQESQAPVRIGRKIFARTEKSRFKCVKCKSYYSSKKTALAHQSIYHRGEKIIKMLGPKSLKDSKTVQENKTVVGKVKPQNDLNISNNLVPKDCIFKCEKCNIHLITCWSAILHDCAKISSRYECDVCCKQFRLIDNETHETQHKHNDAFITYPISKNMTTIMLFWCQKCAVYFELKKIQNHMPVCNGTSSSVRCKVCQIDVSDILTHMQNHKLKTDCGIVNRLKSDFIFIDDLLPIMVDKVASPEMSLKRKLPIDSEAGSSKKRKLSENEFMYCELCRACMKSSIRGYHLTGGCYKLKGKKNCSLCGLVFFAGVPMNSHLEFHRTTKAKFKDFTFCNVTTNDPVVPHIPEFPKCEKCNTHDLSNHKCGAFKTCKICSKKFSSAAYSLHLLHHKYLKVHTEENELIKKYETLTSTWNILYMCKICNVATDSYDDVVRHCQNHYNNIRHISSRPCEICDLNLEESCYKRHKELHFPGITRDSFKTVVYDYKNLLGEDWLMLFGDLSEAQVRQIMAPSLYVTRFVKMKLILDGPPELTIYKCETCKLYVDPQSIYNHTMQCQTSTKKYDKAFACEICSIPFNNLTTRNLHSKVHLKPNITANSFRIVAFNDASDKQYNANLQVDTTEFKPKKLFNVHPSPHKIPNHTKSVEFYQCRQCKCCSYDSEALSKHTCYTAAELRTCKKCQLVFPLRNAKDHREWHCSNPNITKNQIKVVFVDNNVLMKPEDSMDDKKTHKCKLYQCNKCKICYSFWVPHRACTQKFRQCKKCTYMFTPKSYFYHNMWHIQNKNATKKDIKIVPLKDEATLKDKIDKSIFLNILKVNALELKTTLYQCHTCKICSNFRRFVRTHTICSTDKKVIFNCKLCVDLKFRYKTMQYHKKWHEDHKNLGRQHIRVLQFKDMKILKSNDQTARGNFTSDKDRYTCKTCGANSKKITFVTEHKCGDGDSILIKNTSEKIKRKGKYMYYQCRNCEVCLTSTRHFCVPQQNVRECHKCKLKFSNKSLHDHLQKHALWKDMKRSKITIIPFQNQSRPPQSEDSVEPAKKVSKVYKCSCGLHYISRKMIERHFSVCSPDQDIPSENCSKCDLLFPTNHLVSHLVNHHSYGKGNIVVETVPTVTLYRCGACKCLFMNEARLKKHLKQCDPEEDQSERCDKCDLNFHSTEIKMHRDTHKTLSDLNKPCRVVTINNKSKSVAPVNVDVLPNTSDLNKPCRGLVNKNSKSVSNTPAYNESVTSLNSTCAESETNFSFTQFGITYDNHLYKCKDCFTHYLKKHSYIKHKLRKGCTSDTKVGSCPQCGLRFNQGSLQRHLSIHHTKLNLELKDFVIIVCDTADKDLMRKRLENLPESKTNNDIESMEKYETKSPIDNKTTLFKCHVCKLHFLTLYSLRNHLVQGRHVTYRSNCPQCGLSFQEKALDLHLRRHHHKMGVGVDSFNIIEKPDEDIKSVQENKDTSQTDSPSRDDTIVEDPTDTSLTIAIKDSRRGRFKKGQRRKLTATNDILYYNCVKCNVCFTNSRSFELHVDDNHAMNNTEICDLCDLNFPTMRVHKGHHEDNTSGVFFIMDINDEISVNKLYKCPECDVHYLNPVSVLKHIEDRYQKSHDINKYFEKCPDCGLIFSKKVLKDHRHLHHVQNHFRLKDFVIDASQSYRKHHFGNGDTSTVSQSSSEDLCPNEDMLEKSLEPNPEPKSTEEGIVTNKSPVCSAKLYKCGKCNVYFLTQATCYKHIVKHIPMDPKEYIECKLCSFQFRIVSLNTHIRKHHKTDFAFDKVLIEEYQPKSDDENTPKIDIYYAKDKVQSLLVSTTTSDNMECSEVSQSDLTDPEASNDSKETVVVTNTDNIDTVMELDIKSKNVIVRIPSFTEVKGEIDDEVSTPETNECVPKSNEGATHVNEGASNVNEVASNEKAGPKNEYTCGFCTERFSTTRAKEFHESLDHLDAVKDCPICKNSFNTSVLNELHLHIKNDKFNCCICSQSHDVDMLLHHSIVHKDML